jgi:N-methylhydantoinase B
MGATPVKDGENVLSWPSNISSTPVEVAERNSPLFFHYKRMRPGSGGRGRYRGGLGQDILIESRSPRPIVLSVMAERTKYPAPGLAGGGDGGRGDVRINGKRVDNRKQYILEQGDRVLVSTPGGGGYGESRARTTKQIADDRAQGYVAGRAVRRNRRSKR